MQEPAAIFTTEQQQPLDEQEALLSDC